MSCSLIGLNDHNQPPGTLGASLTGTVVSSLHRLKDTDNQDGGFFVWGDLSVKLEGHFRFRFILFEIFEDHVWYIKDIVSNPFPIYSSKNFPGLPETTFLTRSFGDQGIKVRVRKEHRNQVRKRGMAHEDYDSQHFGSRKISTSQIRSKQSTSRESQDVIRSLESQRDIVDTSFDSRSHIGRNYSSQSPPSYSGSITYEESSKRPRTSSDTIQVPTYVQHNQSLNYPSRSFLESHQGAFLPYSSQSQQAAAFNYTCEPSPIFSGSTTPRHQFFTPQLDIGEASSSYDIQDQKSPTSPFFPSDQMTGYSNSMISNLPRIDSSQASYDSLGITARGLPSPVSVPSMTDIIPIYSRLGNSVSYANIPLSPPDRRDAYQNHTSHNYLSNETNGFLSRHSSMAASIDGAATLEGTF